MNKNQTTAHERYNSHIKESLLSGKPVEYSLKDFLPRDFSPQKKPRRKNRVNKNKYEKIIWDIIKEGKKMFPKKYEEMSFRHAYITRSIMYHMAMYDTIEDVKELYKAYVNITHNTPVNEY